MRILQLFFAGLLLLCGNSFAQRPYTLTTQTGQAYQPLTSGTSLNNGVIWDEENFTATMPFNFTLGTHTSNKFSLRSAFIATLDTASILDGFIFCDWDLADKGLLTGTTSLSPIRYTTTGTAPNRIFKMEIANAGFYVELDAYSTMDDSVNMQIWYYETSNIVELHYGPSRISHEADYYNWGNGLLTGYGKSLNIDSATWDVMFTLSGNPANPILDSIPGPQNPPTLLNSFPANGTVYRFTPNTGTTGIKNGVLAAAMKVYPTNTQATLVAELNHAQPIIYRVVAADGKTTVAEGRLQKGRNSIDVSALASGQYFLLATDGSEKAIFRFSKL